MTTRALQHRNRRGSVFVLTLAAIIVLTSLALMLARSTRTEAAASANYVAQLQADAAARGAIAYLRSELSDNDGEVPDDTQIDSEAVPVGGGYFWLLKHTPGANQTYSYGVTDESGKLNLNTADAETLGKLPGMTLDLAAGIVDWRDSNDDTTPGGAESPYYLMQPTPYQSKNSNFETVEELLMVKDITPRVLFGNDSNRNGVFDPADAQPIEGDLGRATQLEPGLADFVTVYSTEPNLDSSGQQRVNVNVGTGRLRRLLSPVLSAGKVNEVIDRTRSGRPFRNVMDFYYRTGMELEEFRRVADRLTTNPNAQNLQGMVNLNTAPREVLASLPQMTDGDAQSIVSQRDSKGDFTSIADVAEVLTQDKATAIGAMVTTRSYRFSADIVATDATGRAFKRYQIVIDTLTTPAKVIYCRDVTSRGWPLDSQLLADLRAGAQPGGRSKGLFSAAGPSWSSPISAGGSAGTASPSRSSSSSGSCSAEPPRSVGFCGPGLGPVLGMVDRLGRRPAGMVVCVLPPHLGLSGKARERTPERIHNRRQAMNNRQVGGALPPETTALVPAGGRRQRNADLFIVGRLSPVVYFCPLPLLAAFQTALS